MKERNVITYSKDRDIAEYNTEDGLGNNYFESLGNLLFCFTNEGVQYCTQSVEEQVPDYVSADEKEAYMQSVKEIHNQKWIATMMAGTEFLEDVECGGILDYDGNLSAVYVDGYLSNLGLVHKGLCQGAFLVDGKVFREICENHHVLVDWANK